MTKILGNVKAENLFEIGGNLTLARTKSSSQMVDFEVGMPKMVMDLGGY